MLSGGTTKEKIEKPDKGDISSGEEMPHEMKGSMLGTCCLACLIFFLCVYMCKIQQNIAICSMHNIGNTTSFQARMEKQNQTILFCCIALFCLALGVLQSPMLGFQGSCWTCQHDNTDMQRVWCAVETNPTPFACPDEGDNCSALYRLHYGTLFCS